MNRRATGVAFLAIAALLFIARYLSAAIFGSSMQGWSEDLFKAMLSYVGPELLTLSIITAVAGMVYLAWAELSEPKAAL